MSCLTTVDLQAIVDGEAGTEARLHVADCPACAARLRERERMTAAMFDALPADLPPHLAHRIDAALIDGRATGATRLRLDARQPRRRAFWSASLAVAATLIAIFFVAPMLKEPSTVSAAEILAAS